MLETSNFLEVEDENGQVIKMEILFTFDSDEYNKKYVVYFDAENDEAEDIFVSEYDEEGNLFPIENEKEWDMIEEVINTFMEDEEDEEIEN